MYQNVSDIAWEVCLSLVAEAHTRGLRPVHLCPMRSLDVPFQPSATHQKGSSNSCWCVCACFILFCVLVLWSVRAKLTSSIHPVTWHVNVSSSQPGNLSSGRAQRTLVHMPPKVAPHGRKCLCELPKDVAVDYRHVHPMPDVLGRASKDLMRNPIPA